VIKILAVIIILGYVLVQNLLKKFDALDSIVFLLPFYTISVFVGINISLFQIITFATFLILLLYKKGDFVIYKPIVIFLGYLTISSAIVSLFFMDFVPLKASGFYRVQGRFILQLIMTIFTQFSLFFVVINKVHSKEKIEKLVKLLLHSSLILASLGVLQFLVYALTRQDIFPIGFVFEYQSRHPEGRSALMNNVIAKIGWVRACSLGGEPKHLANTLVIAFFTSLAAAKMKLNLNINHIVYNIIFLLALLFSLSTTGIVLIIAGLPLFYILTYIFSQKKKTSFSIKSIFIFLFLISFIAINNKIIYKIIEVRVLERELTNDGADGMTQDFLLDQPHWAIFGTGIGNLHNKAFFYTVDNLQKEFYEGNVFIPATYTTKLIAESGLVGLLLFLLIPFSLILQLWPRRKKNSWFVFYIILICIFTLITLSRYGTIYYFLLVLGLDYAATKNKAMAENKLTT